MEWYHILLIVLGSVIVLTLIGFMIMVFSITKLMFNSYVNPKRYTREAQTALFKSQNRPTYDYLQREPFALTLRDGYVINGDISANDPKKVVIIVHGHKSTREGTLKYADLYYKTMGYTVVIFDQRGHGDNAPSPITMGYKESQDLVEIIHYVKNRFGNDITLGLHGTSLGAATILMSTQYQQEASFIIADCPFASIRQFSIDFIKLHHSPNFPFLQVLEWRFKKELGISYKDLDTSLAIRNNEIPTLFIHGALDQLIPPYHSDILFNNNKGYKEQHIFAHGKHAESVFGDPEEYIEVVTSFVKRWEK